MYSRNYKVFEKEVYVDLMILLTLLQLSFDLIEAWLAKNPEAANFEREGQSIFRELALFQDYHGLPSFKKVRLYIYIYIEVF